MEKTRELAAVSDDDQIDAVICHAKNQKHGWWHAQSDKIKLAVIGLAGAVITAVAMIVAAWIGILPHLSPKANVEIEQSPVTSVEKIGYSQVDITGLVPEGVSISLAGSSGHKAPRLEVQTGELVSVNVGLRYSKKNWKTAELKTFTKNCLPNLNCSKICVQVYTIDSEVNVNTSCAELMYSGVLQTRNSTPNLTKWNILAQSPEAIDIEVIKFDGFDSHLKIMKTHEHIANPVVLQQVFHAGVRVPKVNRQISETITASDKGK